MTFLFRSEASFVLHLMNCKFKQVQFLHFLIQKILTVTREALTILALCYLSRIINNMVLILRFHLLYRMRQRNGACFILV